MYRDCNVFAEQTQLTVFLHTGGEVWVCHWEASDSTQLRVGGGRREGRDDRAYLVFILPGLLFLYRGRQFVFGENLLSVASFCFSITQVGVSILGPWRCSFRTTQRVCACEREREEREDRRRAAGSISTGIQSAVFLIQAVCWAFAPHLPFKQHPSPHRSPWQQGTLSGQSSRGYEKDYVREI